MRLITGEFSNKSLPSEWQMVTGVADVNQSDCSGAPDFNFFGQYAYIF